MRGSRLAGTVGGMPLEVQLRARQRCPRACDCLQRLPSGVVAWLRAMPALLTTCARGLHEALGAGRMLASDEHSPDPSVLLLAQTSPSFLSVATPPLHSEVSRTSRKSSAHVVCHSWGRSGPSESIPRSSNLGKWAACTACIVVGSQRIFGSGLLLSARSERVREDLAQLVQQFVVVSSQRKR